MPRRPLPPPDHALVDVRTGLIDENWYDFLRENLRVTNVALTYGATVNTNAQAGDAFTIIASGNFTIAAPTNPVVGQTLTYTISNISGGAIVVTWNSVFHLAGAYVAPATGNNRSISFTYNGASWIE